MWLPEPTLLPRVHGLGGLAVAGLGDRFAQVALQALADPVCTAHAAGDVVADVQDARRAGMRGQERVEGDHAPDLGERHREARTQVVERTFREPAGAGLHGVQGGQEQMAAGARAS